VAGFETARSDCDHVLARDRYEYVVSNWSPSARGIYLSADESLLRIVASMIDEAPDC